MLVANQFSLLHCIVNSESVFDAELWCQQRINFFYQIMVPAMKLFSLSDGGVTSEPVLLTILSSNESIHWRICVTSEPVSTN
jgi:hypothetical protein